MIPTLILFGLVFGRWWRSALIAAAVGWPVLLLATGAVDAGAELFGAAGLAIINTGVGIAINQGGRWSLRTSRQARARRAPGPGEPSPPDENRRGY